MKYKKYRWQFWRKEKPEYSPIELMLLDDGIKPLKGLPSKENPHGQNGDNRVGPS